MTDVINVGTTADDGTGDALRQAFIFINQRFAQTDGLQLVNARYIGALASNPATRYDGTALQTGDYYVNTGSNRFRVYITAAWVEVEDVDARAYAESAASSASAAAAAKTGAELARDAAIIGAGVYATAAAGRAAVADGVAFKVQGSGDVAAFEYRRTNSTTSVLIATYPSAQAVLNQTVTQGGISHALIGNTLTPVISRGTHTNGSNASIANVVAWRSPFKHLGTDFDTVQLTFRTFTNASDVAVQILNTDGVTVLATGLVKATTTLKTHTVALDKVLGGIAADTVLFIAYSSLSGVNVSNPGGGTYEAGVDTSIQTEAYKTTSGWVNAVPAGSYMIPFRTFNLSAFTRSFNDEITSNTERISSIETITGGLGFETSTRKLLGAYDPYVRYQSVLGDAEMLGDNDYSLKILGYRTQVSIATVCNAISCRVRAANSTTNIEWRAWVRSVGTGFNMETVTPTASGTVLAGNFPTTNVNYTLNFPSPIAIGANEFLFVVFKASDNTNMTMRRWGYNAAITPARQGFPLASSDTWNATIGISNPAIDFGQPSVKLFFQSEEIRGLPAATAATTSYSNASSGLAASNVQQAIDLLENEIDAVSAVVPVIVMPPTIFGVVGRECNVYFDNLHVGRSSEYEHDVTSASATGRQQAERWVWTPSAAMTTGSLSVSVHRPVDGLLLTSGAANQRAAAANAGAGLTKNVIVIGDSLVEAGAITQTLIDVAALESPTGMSVTLLGTKGTGANKHEGRGGWTITSYTSNYSDGTSGANPFWISGAVNFPQYLTNNSIAVPDWVVIHLGINDVFGQTTDANAISTATTAFNRLDGLITSIKASGAGVNVALMLPTPPASSQDAFGANYATSQTRWRFKRNILLWTQTLITRYAGQEASRIYIAPTNTAIDTTNNVSYAAAAPVNSRSSVSVARQSNGVHPANSGYQQVGDALWAFLKYYAAV